MSFSQVMGRKNLTQLTDAVVMVQKVVDEIL